MIEEAEGTLGRARALWRHRPLSARSGAAVGPRLPPPHRAGELGRGGAALRRAVDAHGIAGRGHQPRPRRSRSWRGPAPALAALAEAATDPRLAEYQPYWAARAELLARTGAHGDARHAYDRAIGLERDPAVRRFLQRRQSSLARESGCGRGAARHPPPAPRRQAARRVHQAPAPRCTRRIPWVYLIDPQVAVEAGERRCSRTRASNSGRPLDDATLQKGCVEARLPRDESCGPVRPQRGGHQFPCGVGGGPGPVWRNSRCVPRLPGPEARPSTQSP